MQLRMDFILLGIWDLEELICKLIMQLWSRLLRAHMTQTYDIKLASRSCAGLLPVIGQFT
ncbi:hypothetical protein LINGRAHAP2_LOCUS34446 [Linum grandiflorum]